MGLIKHAPTFVAGVRCEPEGDANKIISLDGQIEIPSAVTTASQLREALRYAESSQEKLHKTSLEERVEVVKLVLKEAAKYREEMSWGLAKFRGLVSKDTHWMCDLLINWSEQVDELVSAVWGLGAKSTKPIQYKSRFMGNLSFRSKGTAALITSSTMDGPPGIAAISHAILSGTHVIVRPSWKDLTTHFMFEILHANGLDHYGQMVRWPSSDPQTMSLNRQLIQNVEQGIVFSSDETFAQLIQGMGDDFASHSVLTQKLHKYGTGLPLVIVTGETDLDEAARLIFLGARRGNGKFCLSHSPVLVHESIHSSLLEKLSKLSHGIKVGDLLNRETERGQWEPEDLVGLKKLAQRFGGNVVQGSFGENSMDVLIIDDVPSTSSCLYREYPGTLLALVPFTNLDEAVSVAQKSLKENRREAWTAVNVFSGEKDYKELICRVDSYHFLRGGITSEPKFLLPHQGRYFAFDLSRRLTTE